MRKGLLAIVLLLAFCLAFLLNALDLHAQIGWRTSVNGSQRLSASSTLPAASISQFGTGDILCLYDGLVEAACFPDGGGIHIPDLTPGTTTDRLYNVGGTLYFSGVEIGSGSSGTPGGSDTQVQFNDAGAFGGDAGLTYNKTTDVLSVTLLRMIGASGPLGSAGTPVISRVADTNTGMFFPNNDSIAFSTGASIALAIDTTQSVIVGGATSIVNTSNPFGTFRTAANSTGGIELRNTQAGGYGSWLQWYCRDNYGIGNLNICAELLVERTEDWTSGANSSSRFAWYTIQDGTLAERARLDANGFVILNSVLDLGTAGVRFTGDGDGAFTMLGLGDGSNEDLTINLDDTANTGVITSSTGLNLLTFTSISLNIQDLTVNGTCTGCGSGSPGGATTQIQYNNAGSFAGDYGLTWDTSNKILGLTRSDSSGLGVGLTTTSTRGTPGSEAAVADGDYLFNFQFLAHNGTAPASAGYFLLYVDDTPTAGQPVPSIWELNWIDPNNNTESMFLFGRNGAPTIELYDYDNGNDVRLAATAYNVLTVWDGSSLGTVVLDTLQLGTVNTAAPAGGACDDAAETGKTFWDSTNDNFYLCSGASGWRKIATAAP